VIDGYVACGIRNLIEIREVKPIKGEGYGPKPQIAAIIGGLPRTSTTFLHNLLLAANTAWTSPLVWESERPAIYQNKRAARFAIEASRRLSQARLRSYKDVVPDVFRLHPMDVDDPEECTPLLRTGLGTYEFPAIFRLPEYAEWLTETGLDHTYDLWHDQLELIALRSPDSALVLKSPFHSFGYRHLLSRTDAKIIHVRRSLDSILTSNFALLAPVWDLIFEDSVRDQMESNWCDLWAQGLEAASLELASNSDRIITVDFPDLIADPIATCMDICERLGASMPSISEARLQGLTNSFRLNVRPRTGLSHVHNIGSRRIQRLANAGEAFLCDR
jgi:hypothetical protein